VEGHPLISVYLQSELLETGGFKGNFTSTLKRNGDTFRVQHGATIVATGGVEYKGREYGYGKDSRVVTQLEFEALLAGYQSLSDQESGYINTGLPDHLSARVPDSVVMIQCVGPAERFCSRLCCTTALKNALKLKELNPNANVTILYRDIRTYGFKERLYTEARRAGVRFIHFDFDRKPEVKISAPDAPLSVRVKDPILDREIVLYPDLLVLSTPIVAPMDA